MNEAFCYIVLNSVFRFFVKHQNEELSLLVEFLVFLDVIEFSHQFSVSILFIVYPLNFIMHFVLLEIVLQFFFELSSSFFGFCANHRLSEVIFLKGTQFLQVLCIKIDDLRFFCLLDFNFDILIIEEVPSLSIGVFNVVIELYFKNIIV